MSERAKESLEKQLKILNNKNDALKKQLKNQALALATWQKALGVAKDEKDAESRFLTSRKNWKNSKRRVLNKQVNRIVKDEIKLAQMGPDIMEACVTSLVQLHQEVLQLEETRHILAQENQDLQRQLDLKEEEEKELRGRLSDMMRQAEVKKLRGKLNNIMETVEKNSCQECKAQAEKKIPETGKDRLLLLLVLTFLPVLLICFLLVSLMP